MRDAREDLQIVSETRSVKSLVSLEHSAHHFLPANSYVGLRRLRKIPSTRYLY